MEKEILNEPKSLQNETGNFNVIIYTVAPALVNDNGIERGFIVFTENKTLESAVGIALSLKSLLPRNRSRVYVVHKECMFTYETTFTCVFDF